MDSRLIVALDLADSNQVLEIAKKISNEVFAVKLQWITVMDKGISVVKELSKITRVLCDFKVADIPYTNSNIASRVANSNAWGIITHSFLGRDSLSAVVEAAGNMKVFSVVAMSHPGYSEFMKEHVHDLVKVSTDCGVYGMIAPGNDYKMLREIRELAPDVKIATPGVGAQGGSAVMAIEAGADYVIVGRGVYGSSDPVASTRAINQEIWSALGMA
jgi:orotidine-5'-phosphate decarboxylase